jgi:hypothetical protein
VEADSVKRFALAGVLVVAVLLPVASWACPACANRDDGSNGMVTYFLGAMMLFPFGVAAAVVKVIRGLNDDAQDADSVSKEMESR